MSKGQLCKVQMSALPQIKFLLIFSSRQVPVSYLHQKGQGLSLITSLNFPTSLIACLLQRILGVLTYLRRDFGCPSLVKNTAKRCRTSQNMTIQEHCTGTYPLRGKQRQRPSIEAAKINEALVRASTSPSGDVVAAAAPIILDTREAGTKSL